MSNITLHEAVEQVRHLLDHIDPETGAIPQDFDDARALVKRRAVEVTAYILGAERQADYKADYAAELTKRAAALRKRAVWIRQYLADHMRAAGIERIADERGLFSATLQHERDVAVEIDPGAEFPDELCNPPPPPQPSKSRIRYAIESGQPVQGARLVRRDRLVIK